MTVCTQVDGPQRFTSPQFWFVLDAPIVREGWPDATALCVTLNPPDRPAEPGGTTGLTFDTDGTVYPADAEDLRIIEGPSLLCLPRGSGLSVRGALESMGFEVVT